MRRAFSIQLPEKHSQQSIELEHDLRSSNFGAPGPDNRDQIHSSGRVPLPGPAKGFPQTPPHPIPGHGGAHLASHGETQARRLRIGSTPTHEQQPGSGNTAPLFEARPEVAGGEQAGPAGEAFPPRPGWICRRQTVRRSRPLRRLRESTFRPFLVRMRSRNPWVFLRRRLLG